MQNDRYRPISGHRGRGRGRGRWSSASATSRLPVSPSLPLGALLQTFNLSDLENDSAPFKKTARITDCEVVASYNWLDGRTKQSRLLVPGKPPRWTPLDEVTRLPEDNGQYFRDQNAARCPQHPMEPAITTALTMAPEKCLNLDVVACSSTLGNLLRFVRGRAQDKSFRILVENVNGTVFFIRRENSPTELIEGVRGFGHSFPEAYTTWDADVKGSASHQRMIRYNFGGLSVMLRFEGDGYIAEEQTTTREASGSTSDPTSDTSIRILIEELSTALLPPPSGKESRMRSELQIEHTTSSTIIDQSLIFDLKTRSTRKKGQDILGEEVLPRLWATRISNFILAWHTDGSFDEIEIMDVSNEIEEWEAAHNEEAAMLAAVVHKIVDIARDKPGRKFEVCHRAVERTSKLEIRDRCSDVGGDDDALSGEVRELWIRNSITHKEKDVTATTTAGEEADIAWTDTDPREDYTACNESCGYCGQCNW